MAFGDAASIYLDRGWNSPFPLPEGDKYPPPDDQTGNNPDIDPNLIETWMLERDEANLGLRMPRFRLDGEGFEVLGIDIDHYKTKTGWDTMLHLVETLGPLPATWKTSRHPADNPSGTYFFLVPAGKKWQGKAGSDIDIIQRTHRYTVAWPSYWTDSDDDDRRYEFRWYAVPETQDGALAQPVELPPDVGDLPLLPPIWIEKLLKGNASDRQRTGETGIVNARTAREWLSRNAPGYDKLPSSEMAKASNPDALAVEATEGAHDMIVSRLHRVVMLATEGHHGLRTAIKNIQRAFQEEVMGELEAESARRDMLGMRAEFDRALVGEVVKLKQDIDAGYMMISPLGGLSAEDSNIDTSMVIAAMIKHRGRPNADEYDPNDLGRASMVLDHLGDNLRPIIETKDQWGFWNSVTMRFERMTHEQLVTDVWKPTVIESYKAAAGRLYDEAALQEENGNEDYKETRKKANEMKRLADLAGSRNVIISGMALAHSVSKHRVSVAQMDSGPKLFGVGNGVLDFTGGVLDDPAGYLRDGKPDDLIFSNTGVNYVPGVESQLWKSTLETFLPNLKYRRFVQRTLGYAMLGGNAERLIIFMQGKSSTGKSTIMDAIQSALGRDYADTVSANALFREKQDAGPAPELLKAVTKRIVFSSEIGTHNRLHADVIKRLTGGKDRISARALYSNDVVTQTPMFTPIIATNSMPTIQDGDSPLWRRLLVLPFDRQVPVGTLHTEEIASNMEAREAVLAWLVQGLIDYLLHGLHPDDWPDIVKQRNQMFVEGTSSLQSFLATACVRGDEKDHFVSCTKLHQVYVTWCQQESLRPADILTRNEFYRRLEDNDVVRRAKSFRVKGKPNPQKIRCFVGLKLVGSLG